MDFEAHQIYHVYNQGNNRQQVFFTDANYLYFIRKMRKHLLPYCDVLCYCLMPNHFHWLIVPNENGLKPSKVPSIGTTAEGKPRFLANLNANIATLLSGYSQAINKQERRSGSLFRRRTKARDGWVDGFIGIPTSNNFPTRYTVPYAQQCFRYIHDNPKQAGLVKHPSDWPYSSASDYEGLRSGTLCNQELKRELLG